MIQFEIHGMQYQIWVRAERGIRRDQEEEWSEESAGCTKFDFKVPGTAREEQERNMILKTVGCRILVVMLHILQ